MLGMDRASRFLGALTTEELVLRDDKDDLTPRLAEKVPSFENGQVRIVADAKTPAGRLLITFVLRDGLVWQDGVAITSDDVLFAWQRDLAAPEGTAARADADIVERVDTPDARTAVFTLRPGVRTNRYPLLAHAFPRHVLAGATAAAEAAYGRKPVHAGPYVIASWQEGIGATLVPFQRYALGTPRLTRIDVRFYRDADALVAALQKGEIEMVPSDSLTSDLGPELERFAEGRSLVVRYTPQVWGEFLLFDLRGDYVDAHLRLAVAMAVDRRAINQQLFAGKARIPSSYLFAPSWAAADATPPPDIDLAAARANLAAAGYCASTPCLGARSLRARIAVEGGSAPRLAAAALVAHDLESIGAATTVSVYGASAFRSIIASGEFDLAIASRGGADPAEATADYVSTSPRDDTGYRDPAFDVLAQAAAALLTRDERKPIYAELQRIWTTDLPALPLYQELALDVVPASLGGAAPSALHEPLSWNAYAWRYPAP